ncbi:hypothetical protein BGZ76_004708 [Entomortierella beljakovae]|nr:hypothetical protein BGZ76_004708 [Entomortierella beljakovae]
MLQLLKDNESKDVPIFGVSGCGKTRSVLELLCLQWGFYFNASDIDLGSNDMASMARSIDSRTGDNDSLSTNQHQLCEEAITHTILYKSCCSQPLFIYPKQSRHISTVTRKELLAVKEKLISLEYPNVDNNSKLRLVIDEAQVLGDKGVDKFESFYAAGEPWSMLSSILHGFRNPGGSNDITIIYCGPGLRAAPSFCKNQTSPRPCLLRITPARTLTRTSDLSSYKQSYANPENKPHMYKCCPLKKPKPVVEQSDDQSLLFDEEET